MEPFAKWNPNRDCWEYTDSIDLLSEHLDVYSETFPISGMTRNGLAYERPTRVPLMEDSAYSFLPTPQVADVTGGHKTRSGSRSGELLLPGVAESLTLLPTPMAAEGTKATTRQGSVQKSQTGQVWLTNIAHDLAVLNEVLLPTPSASVANDGEGTATWLARRERVKLTAANGNGMGMPLTIAAQLIGEEI